MKKFIVLAMLGLCLVARPVRVYADELEEPEIVEEVPVEPEETITEEGLTEKIKNTLSQYFSANTVANIITWLASSGILAFALKVLVSVKKVKGKTSEELLECFKAEVGDYVKECFDKLSKEQVDKIVGSVDKLQEAEETVMKVLVLMQDQTASGKVALIDYLGSKTESKEVKESVEQVSGDIKAEEEKVKEIKEKVKEDYKDINVF